MQPVQTGWAYLESGTQLGSMPIYNFSEAEKASSNIDGSFTICAASVASPSAIALLALDSSGKAYPMFTAPITGATALGSVLMGGCSVTCGLERQQQTSLPALIGGQIATAPIAESGSVTAQYTIAALDGSKNLWNISVPSLDPAQGNSFTTMTGGCSPSGIFCGAYSFTLPSEKPTQLVNGVYQQAADPPNYAVYATLNKPSSCTPPFGLTTFQQGGTLFLTGMPGASLTAQQIAFENCQ
jgi:hypothetical protein